MCAQRRLRSAWASASEDSDQPGHSPSLINAQWVAKGPRFLHADSEDSDQTGLLPRLIRVFAVRTFTLLVLSCRGSYSVYSPTCIKQAPGITQKYLLKAGACLIQVNLCCHNRELNTGLLIQVACLIEVATKTDFTFAV